MKLNVTRRLVKEDFPEEYQELIDKLAFPINQFMEQMVSGLNKNITVQDNIPFEFKNFNIQADADGIPIDPVAFKTVIKPKGVVVVSATNITDATNLTGAPFITYSYNNGIIAINHITGLPASKTFTLTALIVS